MPITTVVINYHVPRHPLLNPIYRAQVISAG